MYMMDFLKKGDVCDLVKTLSSEGRDYLIRNNGDRLKIESLRGKIVGIWVSCLSEDELASCYSPIFWNMVETYNQLFVRGDFEIVFVAIPGPATNRDTNKDKNEDLFNALFSTMPWLAIPYFDLGARMRFNDSAYLNFCLFIDKQGVVGDTWTRDDFVEYGAELYPFTAERVRDLIMEGEKALEERTVRSFLSSPFRDYVISNTKERVPISELEEKVVGLYFYKGGETSAMLLTPMLIKVYKELKKRGENFEIVMINLHFLRGCEDNERIFEDEFKLMPWLALPYKDSSCRKLMRMFQLSDLYTDDDHWLRNLLVIVGPGGNIFDCNGANVLYDYGIDAYPFTMKATTEKKISDWETCTLQSVLDSLDIEFAFTKCGEQIPISHLAGKSVVLFIGQEDRRCNQRTMRHQFRQDHGFQVIYVSRDYDLPSFRNFIREMPGSWLTLSFDKEKALTLLKSFQSRFSTSLIVFGPEGRLLKNKSSLPLKDSSVPLEDCGKTNEHELYNNLFENFYREVRNVVLPTRAFQFVYFSDGEENKEDDSKEDEEGDNSFLVLGFSDSHFDDSHDDMEFEGISDTECCASQCKCMIDTYWPMMQGRADVGISDNMAGLLRKKRGMRERKMVVRASKRKKMLVLKRKKVLVSKRKKVLVVRAAKRASKCKTVLVSTDHQGI